MKNFVIYKRQLTTQELDNTDFITKQFEFLNKRLDKIETASIQPKGDNLLQPNSIDFSAKYISKIFWEFLSEKHDFESFQNLPAAIKHHDLYSFISNKLSKNNIEEAANASAITSQLLSILKNRTNYEEADKIILLSKWRYSN